MLHGWEPETNKTVSASAASAARFSVQTSPSVSSLLDYFPATVSIWPKAWMENMIWEQKHAVDVPRISKVSRFREIPGSCIELASSAELHGCGKGEHHPHGWLRR